MKRFIILLRGIMHTGKNKVPMATLRELLNQHGFLMVQTYIQSGNVLLQSSLSKEKVGAKVAALIKDNIGADIKVFVFEKKEIRIMLEGNPFKEEDPSRIFYTFLSEQPSTEKMEALLKVDYSPEKLVIEGKRAYMFIPGSAAKSRIHNNFLENKLNVNATTRNVNTLQKLLVLFDQQQG